MTTTNTKLENTLAELTKAKDYVGEAYDLQGYAAHAAITVLLKNWEEAIRDGTNPCALLSDVDEVCSRLQSFREAVMPVAIAHVSSASLAEPLAALGRLLDYVEPEEERHFDECDQPEDHIYRDAKMVRAWFAALSNVEDETRR